MAELLKYSFQSTDFYRDSNGIAKLKNLGTLGSANDATMYTGQGLEFDGADDYIDLELLDFTSGGTVIIQMTSEDTGGYCGIWDGANRLYNGFNTGNYAFSWGSGYAYVTPSVTPTVVRFVTTSDNSGTFDAYANGAQQLSAQSGTVSAAFTSKYRLGMRSDGSNLWFGTIDMIIFLSQKMTSDDALYDWQNPESIIEMATTGIDNPNFSFPASSILHCITLDEGTGSTVYDIVTGNSYAMVSMPTDDTQWTNADQNEYSHQLARFKKDTNHNPSAPADAHTIRYD